MTANLNPAAVRSYQQAAFLLPLGSPASRSALSESPMPAADRPTAVELHTPDTLGDEAPPRDPEAELLEFVRGRSAPCPRCDYDLRDVKTAKCPECGERLELRLASARPRFGWLVLAVAPGCFSGVAAVFLLLPAYIEFKQRSAGDRPLPWFMMAGEAFGWLSALSLILLYRHRYRVMAWRPRRQAAFALAIWGVHVLMLVVLVVSAQIWG